MENQDRLKKIIVHKRTSIKDTMHAIDRGGLGIAFIVGRNQKFLGTVSDGDIRRSILNGINKGN